MTGIEKAERALEEAHDAVKLAFREIGCKGSAERSEVLKRVNAKLNPIMRTVRSETESGAQSADVAAAVKQTTADCVKRGNASVDTVMAELESSRAFQNKLDLAARELAPVAVRAQVSRFLRQSITTVPEAEAKAKESEAQAELDFANIEEFRGISDAIQYLDADGKIKSIAYRSSTEEQRLSSIELLKKKELSLGERKNEVKTQRDNQIKGNNALHPLAVEFGATVPAEELWKLKLRREKKRSKASGD